MSWPDEPPFNTFVHKWSPKDGSDAAHLERHRNCQIKVWMSPPRGSHKAERWLTCVLLLRCVPGDAAY